MKNSMLRGILHGRSLKKRTQSLPGALLEIFQKGTICQHSSIQSLYSKELMRHMSTSPPNKSNNETGSSTADQIKSSSQNISTDRLDEESVSSSSPSSSSSSSPSKSQMLPFPWRVNAIYPLPRVKQNDDYSGMELTPWARFVRKSFVALELGTSWLDIIFWKRWEQEIVQSCAFAFQRAVCGLLSRSFQVPIQEITNFDDLNCKSLSINTMPTSESAKTTTSTTMTDEDRQFTEHYVTNILDANLLQLYTTIASQAHIDFSLTLVQVQLENAFMIPHLTRSDVYADSSLRGAYTKIERTWKETRDTDAIIDMGRDLQVKTKHHGTKRSLLIDVSVTCLEKFILRDKVSGQIYTGDDDMNNNTRIPEGQIVTHLVRFEMETDKAKNGMGTEVQQRELGHWKIVDIDDMLKGNVWY